jgi:hypothetical protein
MNHTLQLLIEFIVDHSLIDMLCYMFEKSWKRMMICTMCKNRQSFIAMLVLCHSYTDSFHSCDLFVKEWLIYQMQSHFQLTSTFSLSFLSLVQVQNRQQNEVAGD